MNSVLSVLADLDETDVDWLLSNGVEQQVIANDILTETGKMPGALYVVLEGLVGVWVDSLGRDMIRTLGPGQFVGEMAFLEEKPATATVSAIENSLLLSLPRDMLQAKIDTDPAFGLRLYRGLARLLSDRLRGSMAVLGHRLQSATSVTQAVSGRWDTIAAALEKLKHLLADADQAALHNDGELPRDVADRILAEFRVFALWLNSELGDDGPGSAEVRQELGARVQREMLPYLMLTENGERWYAKPRGYAGDFLSIEWIYNNKPTGKGRLGTVLDQCFLDMPAAQAVRNRRGLLCEEIDATIASKNGEPARVLSMACGPAREIFDTFAKLRDPSQLAATCVDIDLQALAFVGDVRDRKKLKGHIRLENANLVYLATGRQQLDLPPQDLAYSIGLIDYFNDSFVVRLLDFVHDRLRPGGRVILGNFHPDNQTKALMDHVLDWRLIHRTEDDMNRLFEASKFGRPCDRIRFEEQRVNLFAMATRPLEENRPVA
jgi:extracellular factor (EF) 3-hydroxypalmitic acid methyl ester biosynthesis protein